MLEGCATWRQDIKSALTLAETVCLLGNQDLDDKAALEACAIEKDLADIALRVLATARVQSTSHVLAAKGACKP